MTSTDIYRGTTGVALPKEVSDEIWAKAQDESVVMSLAEQITLPGSGVTIPVILGDANAYWTAEADNATVSTPSMEAKEMTPYKLSILVPFSNEFKRDADALYNALVERMPKTMGEKFDSTVFGNTAPGSNFDVLGSATAVNIEQDTWASLVTADAAIAASGGILSGWALAPQAKATLLTATDGNDRPLFVNSTAEGAVERLIGAPAHITKAAYAPAVTSGSKAPAQLGYAGDWNAARYGVVSGINIAIADQATLTSGDETINLFQRGMFAVRMDFEVGFRVLSTDMFARLTGNTPA